MASANDRGRQDRARRDRVSRMSVSTPSVPNNVHETAIFVVPASGGPADAAGAGRADLHAGAARAAAAVVARRHVGRFSARGRQPAAGRLRCRVTDGGPACADGGAARGRDYEWSPDGPRLAFISRDAPVPLARQPRRHAGAATRLWVQSIGGAAHALTPHGPLRRQPVVVARRATRSCIRGFADHRVPGAVSTRASYAVLPRAARRGRSSIAPG